MAIFMILQEYFLEKEVTLYPFNLFKYRGCKAVSFGTVNTVPKKWTLILTLSKLQQSTILLNSIFPFVTNGKFNCEPEV